MLNLARSLATHVPQVASKTGPAAVATGGHGSKEDEWAQWLGDEGSVSCGSPSGEVGDPRIAARGTGQSAAAAAPASAAGGDKLSGEQQLSPKLSFRRLGDRIKSMRSFRVKGNKTQVSCEVEYIEDLDYICNVVAAASYHIWYFLGMKWMS